MKKTWTHKIGEDIICEVGLTMIVVTEKRRMQRLFGEGMMTVKTFFSAGSSYIGILGQNCITEFWGLGTLL